MRSEMAGRWLALIALLAVGCGSGTNPGAHITSPSPQSTASPSQATGVCDASHRCLALVSLRGSNQVAVRDVTDIDHPSTVGTIGMSPAARFVSGSEVSFVGADGLVRTPLAGSPALKVAIDQAYITSPFDWSPDAGRLIYLIADPSTSAVHALSAGQDRVLAPSLPGIPAVGCESQFCAGADTWDMSLMYARDGGAVALVVNLPGRNVFRIWTPDGKVLDASDGKGRFMSVWSGGSLYFRDANGISVWRNGAVSTFLPGVAWTAPKASPAGGELAYATRDAHGWHHISVVDTSTRQVREIKVQRSLPTFLTSRYLWYRGERACVTSDNCPSGWSVVDSGKTYIYDLQTGTEYDSIITNVYDVWPHAA